MNSTPPYFIGVDGGGSSSRCLIVDSHGIILAKSISGPTNYRFVDQKLVTQNLLGIINQSLVLSQLRLQDIKHIYLGLAGNDRAIDSEFYSNVLIPIRRECGLTIDTDSAIALFGAICGKPGVISIGGTGCAAFALNRQGSRANVSFYAGPGSGANAGIAGLVLGILDQLQNNDSKLLIEIMDEIGLSDINELIDWLCQPAELYDLAKITKPIVHWKDRNRLVSEAIDWTVRSLATAAIVAAKKVGIDKEDCLVSYTGGLFDAKEEIVLPFSDMVRKYLPRANVLSPRFPPVHGAVFAAMISCYREVDTVIIENLTRQDIIPYNSL